MTNDNGPICSDWSDQKLFENVDAQVTLAMSAPTLEMQLGYLSGASALLRVLRERAERELRERRA